jgi:hypothetical protein
MRSVHHLLLESIDGEPSPATVLSFADEHEVAGNKARSDLIAQDGGPDSGEEGRH